MTELSNTGTLDRQTVDSSAGDCQQHSHRRSRRERSIQMMFLATDVGDYGPRAVSRNTPSGPTER